MDFSTVADKTKNQLCAPHRRERICAICISLHYIKKRTRLAEFDVGQDLKSINFIFHEDDLNQPWCEIIHSQQRLLQLLL